MNQRGMRGHSFIWLLLLSILLTAKPGFTQTGTSQSSNLLYPADFVYKGAIRLPTDTTSDGFGWAYGGGGMGYNPNGDPGGAGDGYPGSLYGVGSSPNIPYGAVSEISIPAPVVTTDVSKMPAAKTLQPFTDITQGKRASVRIDSWAYTWGLAYLPKLGTQATDKLYWTVHEYYNTSSTDNSSLGWSELNFSNPQAKGLWHIGPWGGDYNVVRTSKYLFDVPADWANANMNGRLLMSGRYRGVAAGGHGPTLYSVAHQTTDSPPANGAVIDAKMLVWYPLCADPYARPNTCAFPNFTPCDDWTGAAYITAGTNSAIVIVGRKGLGNAYYGTPPPGNAETDHGFFCDGYEPQFLLYNPADLVAVANGQKQPQDVLPYATVKPQQYLLPDGRALMGGAAFDRARGLFYVFQYGVDTNTSPILHVFSVGTQATNPPPAIPKGLSVR